MRSNDDRNSSRELEDELGITTISYNQCIDVEHEEFRATINNMTSKYTSSKENSQDIRFHKKSNDDSNESEGDINIMFKKQNESSKE